MLLQTSQGTHAHFRASQSSSGACYRYTHRAGELLDTLPPGVDEAVAISKVVQLARSDEYKGFSHIIFDTAPTGHTLRLLTLPEFLEATIGAAGTTHIFSR